LKLEIPANGEGNDVVSGGRNADEARGLRGETPSISLVPDLKVSVSRLKSGRFLLLVNIMGEWKTETKSRPTHFRDIQ
jgi:hypothetical protein